MVEVKFLWRKPGGYGCIVPPRIPVVINPHSYLSVIYPINIKVNFQNEVKHNFSNCGYL